MDVPDPLGVLGHEVRNLIATFVGFSELLLSQDWPPEKQREYLETMRNEGLRVSQFLHELLDLQRMEAGIVDLNLRPINLAELLQFAASLAAHDPRHPVELNLQENLPLAMAEPDRVQQVLANLLSNARKYSPGGGAIRLTAQTSGERVEVRVEDSGVGIPPAALEHIFEKFFRVESLAHRDIRGTGLGLAICRQIVEAHGGRIWAESAGLGRGARVTFTLPIGRVAAPPASPDKAATGLSSRGEHVSAHQRNGCDSHRVPRSTTTQSSRGPRVGLSPRDRSASHGRRA